MAERNVAAEAHYATDAAVSQLEKAYACGEVAAQRAFALRSLALSPGESVLDVGCGVGQLSTELAHGVGPGGRVCGLDTSPAMIARAAERCKEPGVLGAASAVPEWRVGSAAALPYVDASFDVITCVQVLSYCTDPGAALAEMARVLRKPHGRVLVLDTDWRTSVLHSLDAERCARVRGAITRSFGFVDTQLPAKLPSLLLSTPLHVRDVLGFTLAKAGSFESGSYFDVVSDAAAAVAMGVDADEVRAFVDEQEALVRSGGFFYCATRLLFLLALEPDG